VNTSDEITRLSAAYVAAISNLHHKDRDCHFFVEKRWSYGEAPYYIAYHYGYHAERWTSPRCRDAASAETLLLRFLRAEIESLRKWATESANEPEPGADESWWGYVPEEGEAVLEALKVLDG
jgi:hypothetical protein